MSHNKTAKIVKLYRESREMSLREFADTLSVDNRLSISHQLVHTWETGETIPTYATLVTLSIIHGGWQCDFARDCLSAIAPNEYEPVTDIGKSVLFGGDNKGD